MLYFSAYPEIIRGVRREEFSPFQVPPLRRRARLFSLAGNDQGDSNEEIFTFSGAAA